MILRHTPNAEMQNMSSKLHAAITSVMIPLSSPRPFCLKSNNAGRITAELTGLKIHLSAEELCRLGQFFVDKNKNALKDHSKSAYRRVHTHIILFDYPLG